MTIIITCTILFSHDLQSPSRPAHYTDCRVFDIWNSNGPLLVPLHAKPHAVPIFTTPYTAELIIAGPALTGHSTHLLHIAAQPVVAEATR